MSEERRKLSWREIDKLKDSSGLAKLRRKLEKGERTPLKEDKKAKERYLKELEKLFSGKGNGEKEDFLNKLHQSTGKRDFQKLLLEFYKKFGLPDSARDLILFLNAESKEILYQTLEKIKERFSEFNLSEKQGIFAKLKALQLSTKDEALAYKTEKLLKELSF
ncbi:MAG: hypothetical protein ABWJ99_05700 [Caldimicrobium sp.]